MGKWSRNLYEKTDYPDTYTPDDCFLAAIHRNKNLNKYTLHESVACASQVTLQFSSVILFYSGYIYLKQGWISSFNLLKLDLILALMAYLIAGTSSSLFGDFRHLIIFVTFGYGLTPVLFKLTDTISTDTIHTMSWIMLFLHLLLHNYSVKAYDTKPMSLNASLFSAVCLASRLDSSWDAFVLLSVAVVLFVLFPMARVRLDQALGLAFVAESVVVGVCFSISCGFGLGVACAMVFVNIIAPMLFVKWQSYKETIHGPWDEAVPLM
ncbi:hypothetical protein TCAL_05547 [Tigriopus californicus]|uniref:Phosphatidylinositol N-acetylglucosaminyltransferase subunit C n=1 Tax=Tigriopus californicus TaxID=6832 RepID=A0A553P5Q1_TIGCA|nr:phosphatidylinositol N-acetylglucosaminyltransferase subunit C-like [Tigriopus californicus]TRY72992.1 hypothetical protein TCAL_05547 [Tigriopus californicus]|eukprot:TCALIF_05547-PA protein Name:"Similar to PIGC Phosphatidylinositol N-acetylglucosaminyltransferase subunit C (Homo sapiens)" AED:0.03 eAED:0.03 QI:0/-1/0/1/-1/1/1/0/265